MAILNRQELSEIHNRQQLACARTGAGNGEARRRGRGVARLIMRGDCFASLAMTDKKFGG
jgi:hypothetical protein